MKVPGDPLVAYMARFLGGSFRRVVRPPFWAVRNFGTVTSLVLHRDPPFQVELFITTPGDPGFPRPHRHPNVDTFEVYLSGELPLVVSGQEIGTAEQRQAIGPDGASALCGLVTRVGPEDWHGASTDDPSIAKGAAFLSIQHWLNGVEPTSVGLDWEGPPTHDEQRKRWQELGVVAKGESVETQGASQEPQDRTATP